MVGSGGTVGISVRSVVGVAVGRVGSIVTVGVADGVGVSVGVLVIVAVKEGFTVIVWVGVSVHVGVRVVVGVRVAVGIAVGGLKRLFTSGKRSWINVGVGVGVLTSGPI